MVDGGPRTQRRRARKQVVVLLDDESEAALALLTADTTSKSAAIRTAIVEAAVRLPERPPVPGHLKHLPYAQAIAIHNSVTKTIADFPPLTADQRALISSLFHDSRVFRRSSSDTSAAPPTGDRP